MRVVVRQLALSFLVAMCPGLAFGVSETYEGQLIPMTGDTPIPIVVQFEDVGGFLSGSISTSSPYKYTARIDSGQSRPCSIFSCLASTTLRSSSAAVGPEADVSLREDREFKRPDRERQSRTADTARDPALAPDRASS